MISVRARLLFSRIVMGLSLCAVIAFGVALFLAFKSHKESELNCHQPQVPPDADFSYIQLNLLDQNHSEPYFNGLLFASLGSGHGQTPVHESFSISASQTFGQWSGFADLNYDQPNKTLWMSKPLDITLNRTSGSHRDFPFDSAHFDFDLTYDPAVPFKYIILRNANSSFDISCKTFTVNWQSNVAHISFDAKRNPVVRLTAFVLVGAAFIFLVAIVTCVKTESLPTSVASYFFSLWSIRAILSSEIKTFPTLLDMAILSMCVLLLGFLGVRLAWKEIPATKEKETNPMSEF
jgi:hypothetical protein